MPEYPFTALIGADTLRQALLLVAVDPSIGGVLITGTRGTAKSTAARALAALLPQIDVVRDDPYNRRHVDGIDADTSIPTPFVELPVGASEDRVIGALDTRALLDRRERFKPGLLARANRGILYIDEVNLLPDHVVDVVLDVAATGRNIIEREGLSFAHDARSILIGTMNPEEGELRPQLLDRFGLCVESANESDVAQRVAIVERRLRFEADRPAFVAEFQTKTDALRARIEQARVLLSKVVLSPSVLQQASQLALEAGAEGMRADLTIVRTARAIAAFAGRSMIDDADIVTAAELALAHRRRDSAPRGPGGGPPPKPSPEKNGDAANERDTQSARPQSLSSSAQTPGKQAAPSLAAVGQPTELDLKRARRRSQAPRGAMRVQSADDGRIAVAPTILAAAVEPGEQLVVGERHLRFITQTRRQRRCVIVVVDASGSMAAAARMRAAKGVVCSLLEDAYRSRDMVSLIAFHGNGAEVLVPLTRSPALAYRRLQTLPSGGKTPLAEALAKARLVAQQGTRRNPHTRAYIVVVSDARANIPEHNAFGIALQQAQRIRKAGIDSLCIDTESGRVRLGLAKQVAQQLGATYRHIDACSERTLSATIREWMAAA